MQDVNQRGTSRWTMLRAGAASGTASALGAAGVLAASDQPSGDDAITALTTRRHSLRKLSP